MKRKKVLSFNRDGDFHYKLAEKYFIRNDYINALKFYRKAVDKEPKNLDYKIRLATILTDMDFFHQSNNILFHIISKDLDCPYCYYLMGCNYLALSEYEKVIDCFYRYIELDPDGDYYDYVINILNVLETQQMIINEIKRVDDEYREMYTLISKGRKLMVEGEYSKAIKNMEKALDIDSSMIDVKNNLAIAYYYIFDINKAIEISRQVIEAQPDNLNACCNLSIFYNAIGQHESSEYFMRKAERLLKDESDIDYLYKFCVTSCKLECNELANKYLKTLAYQKPYDCIILHYLGVSYMRLKKFKKAIDCWDKIIRIKKHDSIALYYRNQAMEALKTGKAPKSLNYEYQVPEEEFIRRIKLINNLFSCSKNNFKRKWEQDAEIRDLLHWGLDLYNNDIKAGILNLLGNLDREQCEPIYKEFIKRPDERTKLKRIALEILSKKGAKGPYIAFMKGEYVEVKVCKRGKPARKAKKEDICNFIINSMKDRYEDLDSELIRELWKIVIKSRDNFKRPGNLNPDVLAAAFEYYYCREKGIQMTQKEIARYYKISVSTLSRRYRLLVKLIKGEEV
ncbi:MAG: tetratricopeptide repeat protein [Clostridia bacterium]|nr:tetratricopeptide repeat protein [Clostridia bacterium]